MEYVNEGVIHYSASMIWMTVRTSVLKIVNIVKWGIIFVMKTVIIQYVIVMEVTVTEEFWHRCLV